MPRDRLRICIGIPCYQNAPAETLEDYIRFAYYLGRNLTEYDFYLAIKPKFEQFRARNAIVTAAMQQDCDYLLMIDDDHVIDWENSSGPSKRYAFLKTLLGYMENDPKLGIVGALYYHRGGDCLPVLMKEGADGGYYYMRDDQIKGELQDVAVTGGGCMLLRMSLMVSLPQPLFEPEFKYGTDIQICRKVWNAGYRVACDTSIVLGHVMTKREIVTPENRSRIMMESNSGGSASANQFDQSVLVNNAYNLYWQDGCEYLGITSLQEITKMAEKYNEVAIAVFPDDPAGLAEYYEKMGNLQLARQMFFHGSMNGLANDSVVLSMFKGGDFFYGLDYGCGSSPVGFELVLRGHNIDFVDLPGAGGYKFLKWRAKRRKAEERCGWELKGPYSFVLLLDSLEHLVDPVRVLEEDIIPRIADNGCIITNYFCLKDSENIEHISMNRETVKDCLVRNGIYPLNKVVWMKRDLAFMDKKTTQEVERQCLAS